MKVDRPNAQPLTPEEAQELNRLRTLIETAIADGVVTEDELSAIRTMALTPKPSYELLSQELAMYRELVTSKVQAGLLVAEQFSE
ncbi:hypothetical protein H6G45_16030 [Synechocystis sp. FACHB-383]|uniref:hypothetical protein n=1 Tax=Synechocystis sp. FACHB-383 TaxID=2692864 RepID=UPI001685B6C2|nr:hypothetical protein [Synechocystis sp. FACHB-383]MBD2654962.1 hypothetical protein [Synechocystis sp. FACHB-383]